VSATPTPPDPCGPGPGVPRWWCWYTPTTATRSAGGCLPLPPEIACSVWPICWGLQITKNLSIS
jgi:hypothetical protein